MGTELKLFQEEPAKLIVNRRAIAAGLASLMALPMTAKALAKDLGQLSNIPLSFDPESFAGMMRDDLFVPDYRFPMVRLGFDDGTTTRWHKYVSHYAKYDEEKKRYIDAWSMPKRPGGAKASYIEICAPDRNGNPRYAQLQIV